MIFSNRESIEDMILRILTKQKSTSLQLVDAINKEGVKISYQAVYKAIKFLLKDTIIVKSGKDLSISQEWADKVTARLSGSFVLPPLSAGESVSYSYLSLAHLDAYWKHINKALEQKQPNFPIFIYNPYGIWLHLNERYESEVDFLSSFEKDKQYGFLVIGNNSALDRDLKKDHQNSYLQIDLWKNTSFVESDYFTIKGDYIITTKLNKKLTPKITYIYRSILDIEKAKPQLREVLKESSKSKLKLEYNPEKAKMLRKKLFKNFYMPKEIKNKYELF